MTSYQPDKSENDYAPIRIRMVSLVLMMAAFIAGCESRRAHEDFVPAGGQAKQALEQMLDAWRRGETSKAEFQLPGNGPRVQIFDKEWSGGRKLSAAEIVKELPAESNGPRQYAVKLSFDGEGNPVETSYFVVGIDPLMIFSEREYKQTSGMN